MKCKVAAKPLVTFKQRIRELTSRSGGRSMLAVVEKLRAWVEGLLQVGANARNLEAA